MSSREPARFSRRDVLIIVTCSLSLFITSLDSTIVNVALPSIQRALHAHVDGLEWVVDSYLLVVASLMLLSGSTGDRIGRRRMFTTGLVIFAASSLVCSLMPNLTLLIVFRMFQAVGGSMLAPNSLSILTNTFTDHRRRAVALGIWAGIFGVSAACGPVVGGVLVTAVGWRSVFWVTAPVGVLGLLLAYRFVPESRAGSPRPVDVPGQVCIAALLACLTYAIIAAPTAGWTSNSTLALFSAAAALLVTFVLIERRSRAPLLDPRFFKSPPFAGAAAMAVLSSCVFAGFLFVNTLYLQDARGESPLDAGLMTLPATAIVAVMAPLSGRMVARWGSRSPLLVSGIFVTLSGVVLLGADKTTPYAVVALAYAVVGLGYGLVNPPITSIAVAGMPIAQAGTAGGVTATSRQVGNVLGVALMGALTASRFASSVGPRLAAAGVPAVARRAIAAQGATAAGSRLHAGLSSTGSAVAGEVVRATLAVSTHAAWEFTIAMGVILTAVVLRSTSRRAFDVAKGVGQRMGLQEAVQS